MYVCRRILTSCTLLAGMLPIAVHADSLTLVTMPIQGLTSCCDEPGKPVGPLIDAAYAVMHSAGLDYKVRLMPWARAVHLARTVENTCVVGLRKSEENATQYKWAGPLMRGSVRILRRQDDSFRANNEMHLSGKTIGVLRGSTYIARLERAGAKVELADSMSMNVGKLLARRIDLLATSSNSTDDNLPMVELFKIDVGDANIACHPALDDAVMARLNAALAEVRNSGALRQFGL